ncbi:MAG: hypothetical protein R2825_08205 [Saprospiraceae bacterium]
MRGVKHYMQRCARSKGSPTTIGHYGYLSAGRKSGQKNTTTPFKCHFEDIQPGMSI